MKLFALYLISFEILATAKIPHNTLITKNTLTVSAIANIGNSNLKHYDNTFKTQLDKMNTKVVKRSGCKYGEKAFIVNSDSKHAYNSTLKTTVLSTGQEYYEEKYVSAGSEFYIGCTSLDGIHFNEYEVTGETVAK